MNIEKGTRDFDLILYALTRAKNDELAAAEHLSKFKRPNTIMIDQHRYFARELDEVIDRIYKGVE